MFARTLLQAHSRLHPRTLVVMLLFCALLGGGGCSTLKENPVPSPAPSDSRSPGEQDLGIQILSLRLTAQGYMIDFRYKAVDPDKAEILFSRQVEPYLLHEATGAAFSVPATKVGPMRETTNKPLAGKGYFMLFGNPGRYVKSGDKVTVIFGKYRIEHLTVE